MAFIACTLGVVSHFYPIPFPKNKLLLAGCVIGYVICASIYYLIENKAEGNNFYRGRAQKIAAIAKEMCVFASELDVKGGSLYKLSIRSNGSKNVIEKQYPVTMFFDEKGYMHRYKVKEAFDELLSKYINAPK